MICYALVTLLDGVICAGLGGLVVYGQDLGVWDFLLKLEENKSRQMLFAPLVVWLAGLQSGLALFFFAGGISLLKFQGGSSLAGVLLISGCFIYVIVLASLLTCKSYLNPGPEAPEVYRYVYISAMIASLVGILVHFSALIVLGSTLTTTEHSRRRINASAPDDLQMLSPLLDNKGDSQEDLVAEEFADLPLACAIAVREKRDADARDENIRVSRGYGTCQLLRLARPHRYWLYAACLVLVIRLPFSLSIPHFVAETIGGLIDADFKAARWNVVYLAAAGTCDAFLDFWTFYLFGLAQQRIIRSLRLDLFSAILRQEVGFFDSVKSGEITSRLNTDCAEMANDLTWVFRFSIEALVRIGGIIGYMFFRSWRLGLLALTIVIPTALVNRFYGRFLHLNQKKVQTSLAAANSMAQEVIAAIRTVLSFGMEGEEIKRYRSRVQSYYALIVWQYFIQAGYYGLCNTWLINTIVQGGILLYGSWLCQHGLLEPRVLVAFMLYQGQLQEYCQSLFNSFTSLIKSSGAAAKVFDYIERIPRKRLHDSGSYDSPHSNVGLGGHVEFRNVCFAYPSRPTIDVLKSVSFEAKPGETVALVGASGSGKSSCLQLLKTFYDPQIGDVRIDGKLVAQIDRATFCRTVAAVSQDPVLMSGTVEYNIMYGSDFFGLPSDDVHKYIVSAAKSANAHDFILRDLPNGYQTEVGERGVQLSGGQKQRIAIARCLLRNPKVLLLDEATSALDSQSEAVVQDALNKAMVGRTTLVVAHRLSTIRGADRIIVMENGEIVEIGSHEELISRPSRDGATSYKKLIAAQANVSA